jgi:3-oxoacyl-[acyl-carrier-protein] synthase-3
MKIKIRAIEKYLPGKLVESSSLEKMMGLKTGWIEKNTGVISRYWSGKGETIASMGSKALSNSLTKAGCSLADLDLLIYAGGSYDYPIPYNACLIKNELSKNTDTVPCFDVDATCLSFIHALDIAHLYIQSGRAKRVAIVSAELSSRSLNPEDPKTYSLFGDAAVAFILEASEAEESYTVGYTSFINYSEGAMFAMIPTGGIVNSGMADSTTKESYYFKMDGKKLIRLTQKTIDGFISEYEKNVGLKLNEYNYIIPHQPSKFGNDLFVKQFHLNPERVLFNLPKYGNCISASIALGLEEIVNSKGSLKGKNVLLIGTAAGLSYGAITLKF